ncbi:hypothetical protein BGW39_004193, partial [Mortierella sp. 14UC]
MGETENEAKAEQKVLRAKFQAELDESRRLNETFRRFTVPIGKQSVLSVLKALNVLWMENKDKRSYQGTKPRETKVLMAEITLYERRLVHDRAVPTLDRGSYCALRDGYEIPQFVRMMTQLWRGDYPRFLKYSTHHRDRVSISLRHHLLLRDEDVRNLDLSDCFCEVVESQLYGTSFPVR